MPARTACITFDDGYADNLDVASPILRKLRFPATFFITADAVERGIKWNDLVKESMRRTTGAVDLRQLGLSRYRILDDKDHLRLIHEIVR